LHEPPSILIANLHTINGILSNSRKAALMATMTTMISRNHLPVLFALMISLRQRSIAQITFFRAHVQ
jgi:hypothetical protein